MKEIFAKVRMTDNIAEGCKIVRSYTNMPIKDIKQCLTDGEKLLSVDYLELDELKLMKQILDELIRLDGEVSIFREYREVDIAYLSNTIQSYEEITQERETLDELLFDDE